MPPLTDAQLRAELERCRSCEAKPCRSGCPAHLSPADFIRAARGGAPSDYRRAAAQILSLNPLGGTCGAVCPDTLCMARCSRGRLDAPVDIPAIQAAIVARARALGVLPRLDAPSATGLRVAVVGAGPAGLGAASVLTRAGHEVHLFDREPRPGGMVRRIPRHRLDPRVLDADLEWLLGQGGLHLDLGTPVALPRELLAQGFAAVIVAGGLSEPLELDVPGAEHALPWTRVLGDAPPPLAGRRVAVVGDGPVAFDCAGAALGQGAAHVEIFALRSISELGLTRRERDRLFASGVHATFRVRVTAIRTTGRGRGARVAGLALRRVALPPGVAFHPSRLRDVPHGEQERRDLDTVILAIGARPGLRREPHPRIVYAGDLESGPTTVVEAIASGKRAGLEAHRRISGEEGAACPDRASCPEGGGACPKRATCPEWSRPGAPDGGAVRPRSGPRLPVALDCDHLGHRLRSPFLLAAPHFTSGYAPVRRAYEAGWAGAVMRLPPGEEGAAGAAARLLEDAERLRHEFPDRLTLVAPEGPMGGDPVDYREAAALLARGAGAVPIATLAVRQGLAILEELESGLSHLLAERGLRSVAELGRPPAARPSMAGDGPAMAGGLAQVDAALCSGCANCTRCPYGAVALDARGLPRVDAARCTGCGLCVEPCFVGAIAVHARA